MVENASQIFNIAWQIILSWWWLPLPFLLMKPFLFLYWWWRVDRWLSKQRWIVLEVKMPREILKPMRAMETVMVSCHGAVFHPPDWWEKWVDGQVQLSLAFEIASLGGETHMYVRTPILYRDSVEAAIYSQYPGAEINEALDYAKQFPQNAPNQDWDMWGTDYKLLKDDHHPIRTYRFFETEHEAKEEKRVDPVATLFEAMSKVKPTEQFWIQIIARPIADDPLMGMPLTAWVKKGEAIRDKLAKRPEKPKQKPIIQEAAEILITGKQTVVEVEKDVIPPEMRLTPGEKLTLTALEEKMSKPIFQCGIRFIYFGKRGDFLKANFRLGFSFFNAYMTIDSNGLVPLGKTITKIKKSWFLPLNSLIPRRHYMRCRKLFRNYVNRFSPYFPRPGGTFVLNVEELASLFHFPGEAAAPSPGAPRIETKRGEGPMDLPVE